MTEEPGRPCCGNCGKPADEIVLYYVPGGWGWNDDKQDGRLGLCAACGQTEERYRERFVEAFGVQPYTLYVSDSDQAGARETVTRPT